MAKTEVRRRKNGRDNARRREQREREQRGPGKAKTCECESPWPQKEDGYVDPTTGESFDSFWSCAKCSREIV